MINYSGTETVRMEGPSRSIAALLFALALLAVALSGATPTSYANTTVDLSASDGSAVCPSTPLYGLWSVSTVTCTFTQGITIPSGVTLIVDAGITVSSGEFDFNVAGALTNYGSIISGGKFGTESTGVFTNYGKYTDSAGGGGLFGTVTNEAGLRSP
jgi:hypothetical protein